MIEADLEPLIELRPSIEEDIKQLSKTMREKDRQEAVSLGYSPHKALQFCYEQSLYRMTGLVDGGIAAMWGVAGTPLGLVGQPYLVTSNILYKLPSVRSFINIYKQEVETMLELFPILENYVDASYEGAVRMLRIAGFTLSEPFQFGQYQFRKFTRMSK